jgi:hypothetical protein
MTGQPDFASLPTWAEQLAALQPVGENLLAKWGRADPTAADQRDMDLLALSMLASGYLCHVYADPRRPLWTPIWNHAFNQGGPNPDYVYLTTPVEDHGTYRISGYRGTARFVEIAQQGWQFLESLAASARTNLANAPGPTTHDIDDLARADDGYFTAILSPDRPAGYDGDWWQLNPGARRLLLRVCSCDWRREVDARVAIERLDEVPAPSVADAARRVGELPRWIEGTISFDMELAGYYRRHHATNGLERSTVVGGVGGLPNQVYYDGIYEIEDDEALVVETALPRQCRYWQMLVADDRFSTVDWVNRQSSLNDVQARVDPDGRLRVVISARDPGVPNWLDKADNRWGIIQMRLNKPSDLPEPTVARVKAADVRSHLPADTPAVTAEERGRQLRQRREAAQLRRLW